VQPGNLVKITRASIGIPNGTIGLVLKVYPGGSDVDAVAYIQICNAQQRTVRRLERDLEVLSANR
jgi:hypothetical protein